MFISSRCASQASLPSRTWTSQPGQPHGTIVSGVSVGSCSGVTAPSLPSEAHRSWWGLPIAPGVPLKHQGLSPSAPTTSGGERGGRCRETPKSADTRGAMCLIVTGVDLVRMCSASGPGSSSPWSLVRRPRCPPSVLAALVRVISLCRLRRHVGDRGACGAAGCEELPRADAPGADEHHMQSVGLQSGGRRPGKVAGRGRAMLFPAVPTGSPGPVKAAPAGGLRPALTGLPSQVAAPTRR
jgi:hypothetical protein